MIVLSGLIGLKKILPGAGRDEPRDKNKEAGLGTSLGIGKGDSKVALENLPLLSDPHPFMHLPTGRAKTWVSIAAGIPACTLLLPTDLLREQDPSLITSPGGRMGVVMQEAEGLTCENHSYATLRFPLEARGKMLAVGAVIRETAW